jgi:hypothetical protein
MLEKLFSWRHDTQHNDTPHNNTQHKDIQHNETQHNQNAALILCRVSFLLSIASKPVKVMLNVIMLIVITGNTKGGSITVRLTTCLTGL